MWKREGAPDASEKSELVPSSSFIRASFFIDLYPQAGWKNSVLQGDDQFQPDLALRHFWMGTVYEPWVESYSRQGPGYDYGFPSILDAMYLEEYLAWVSRQTVTWGKGSGDDFKIKIKIYEMQLKMFLKESWHHHMFTVDNKKYPKPLN